MTDLSAYRERFPAVGAWTRWAHENLAPEQRTIEGGIARADDALAALAEALGEAEEARDLAIAHDRQPYPTAYAYETLCKAFDYWRGRAEQAEADHNSVAIAYDERYAQLTAAWAELAAYRSDQADDYSEDKRELERKYTEQMKRAEQAEAELAELKARRCTTCKDWLHGPLIDQEQCRWGYKPRNEPANAFACNRYERRES